MRHPIDRFISAFNGLKGSANEQNLYSRFVRQHIDPFETVEEFGHWMARTPVNTSKVLSWLHFRPQYSWVTLDNKNVNLDEILHFETLAKDWPIFAEKNGFPQDLPFIGKGRLRHNNIDSQLNSFLRHVYREDFDLFGYF